MPIPVVVPQTEDEIFRTYIGQTTIHLAAIAQRRQRLNPQPLTALRIIETVAGVAARHLANGADGSIEQALHRYCDSRGVPVEVRTIYLHTAQEMGWDDADL